MGTFVVVQVLLLHQIFGDEPSRLPKDPVTPPSIDPQHTEEFPDLILCGTVTIHEDDPQEHHDETRLGGHPPITWTIVCPEVDLADDGVDVPSMVDFLHLQAKDQLHALTDCTEDLREVLPVLPADDFHEYQADERAGVARLSWGVSGR